MGSPAIELIIKIFCKNHYIPIDILFKSVYIVIMKTKKTDWESIIRKAIEDSGLSAYRLAKESGISQPQISRFIAGKRTLTLPAAEKIARVVGLELKKRGK